MNTFSQIFKPDMKDIIPHAQTHAYHFNTLVVLLVEVELGLDSIVGGVDVL